MDAQRAIIKRTQMLICMLPLLLTACTAHKERIWGPREVAFADLGAQKVHLTDTTYQRAYRLEQAVLDDVALSGRPVALPADSVKRVFLPSGRMRQRPNTLIVVAHLPELPPTGTDKLVIPVEEVRTVRSMARDRKASTTASIVLGVVVFAAMLVVISGLLISSGIRHMVRHGI